jgi:2-polyprenyl-3-methyl-5-hydroxy-6-metoxy-1,4-benzoquinol methylase
MNYTQQHQFLTQSRISGVLAVLLMFMAGAGALRASSEHTPHLLNLLILVVLAVAASIYYTPDYLHLTVDPGKNARWAVRVRWRIIGAVLVVGLIAAPGIRSRAVVLLVVLVLLAVNLLARAARGSNRLAQLFGFTDLLLILTLLLWGQLGLLMGGLMLAAAAHFCIVMSAKRPFLWAGAHLLAAGVPFMVVARSHSLLPDTALFLGSPFVVSALATAWLVQRAQVQNRENIAAAVRELQSFTGYPLDRIRELWATSNQRLAANWKSAAIAPDDAARLAAWYRDNSELYLFAISGYNLEYKRIRSNMKVLKFARGATLDYGAGNGELLLELARRGHPVTYYDVDGVTMRFARSRAQQYGLAMEFFSRKEDLLAAAAKQGFDTIFSFDVLEHLPDLPGELDFLLSMLNPGGLMVFDVPAGSTKAHPMHLNHNLNVLSYMADKGLQDKRGLFLRLPFRKEEKYVFMKLVVH